MSHEPFSKVLFQLRRLSRPEAGAELSDRDLLRSYADEGNQDAYAEVLRRHSTLVMATCRRWLRNEQSAEDAFQAVFLILARKANSISWRESIAGWLHRVAVLVCRKHIRGELARKAREKLVSATDEADLKPKADWGQMQQILDEEIAKLPDKFRGPLLLCCFEELPHKDAAARLGISPDSLRGRLFRGREMLRARLARRDIQLSSMLVAGAMSQQAALTACKAALLESTARAAVAFAASVPNTVAISPHVLTLAQGGLQAMFLLKLQSTVATLAAVCALTLATIGGSLLLAQSEKPEKSAKPAASNKSAPASSVALDIKPSEKPIVAAKRYKGPEQTGIRCQVDGIDEKANRITFLPEGQKVKLSLDLAKEVKVLIADDPAKLSELKPKDHVILQLAADNRTVTTIEIEGEDIHDKQLVSVNLATLTLSLREANPIEVRKNAVVVIDGFLGELKDLEPEMRITILLSRDEKTATKVFADSAREGDVQGRIKSLDLKSGVVEADHRPGMEQKDVLQIGLYPETRVFVNGTAAKLGDLKEKMRLKMRMDEAKERAMTIRAWTKEAE